MRVNETVGVVNCEKNPKDRANDTWKENGGRMEQQNEKRTQG